MTICAAGACRSCFGCTGRAAVDADADVMLFAPDDPGTREAVHNRVRDPVVGVLPLALANGCYLWAVMAPAAETRFDES